MTETIDSLSETAEADLTPGTLCWVTTGHDAPTTVRNSRCLAIYTQGVGSNRWLLLIPNGDNPQHGTHGWVLGSNLTNREMERMHATQFIDTHRGWWSGNRTRFIETCAGHWCVEHQAFHATPTCPPPDPFITLARIRQLEKDLADAKEANTVLVREHEAWKTKASEILGEEADNHDLCGEYDHIAERAGLYRRARRHEVTIEVTYRQSFWVEARNASEADDEVTHAGLVSGWHPDLPIDVDMDEDTAPTDVTFKVIVEPPF